MGVRLEDEAGNEGDGSEDLGVHCAEDEKRTGVLRRKGRGSLRGALAGRLDRGEDPASSEGELGAEGKLEDGTVMRSALYHGMFLC